MRHLAGFAPLAGEYDAFILDLWGVIHDGMAAFPWAIDTLRRLEGRPVILLSNAPRRARAAAAMLTAMGIAPALYTGIVTSGEAAHDWLRARAPLRLIHLGPERDRNLFDAPGLTVVSDPEDAGLLVNTGPDDENPCELASYETLLGACRDAALPMLCANPDLEVIRGGVRVLCAGSLAARYRALGGTVTELGKPDPAIYAPILARLGAPAARVLAVGDSLRTDIAGAAATGLDSAWVLGGIDTDPGEAARRGLHPVACLPTISW